MWSKANEEQPSNKQQLEKMWQDMSPPQQEGQRLTVPEGSDKVLNKTVNHRSRAVGGCTILTVPMPETSTCGMSIGEGCPSHFSSNFFLVQLLHLPQPALAVQKALSVRPSSTATSLKTSVPRNKHFLPFSVQCLGVFWQMGKELICSTHSWNLQLGIPWPSLALQGAVPSSDT